MTHRQEGRVRVRLRRFADRPALQLQWLDPGTGRRRTRSAGTADPEGAEAARVDLEADLNAGRHRGGPPARARWRDFRERFEAEYLPGVRPGTRQVYRTTLDAFERLCRPGLLAGLTARAVSCFAAGLRQSPGRGEAGRGGMQASTVKVRLQFLRTALCWAQRQGLLGEVPAFPAVRVPRRRPQPVPEELFARLAARAPTAAMRAFVSCGWLAGLRLGEAQQLSWEDDGHSPWVDIPRRRIWLPAASVKGGEDQWVPLDPALARLLLAVPRDGPRVFPWAHLSREAAGDRVIALARRAGVRLTMRSLRRGFACRYAGRVPAQVLQKLLRHADIKTTLDYYASVDAAVEDAVLGPCNISCNITSPDPSEARENHVFGG